MELTVVKPGAAAAFEDAACLTQTLRRHDTLAAALSEYQTIRMPRAAIIQAKSREHQELLHVPDGEFQSQRDIDMALDQNSNPLFWGWADRRKWLFAHDAGKAEPFVSLAKEAGDEGDYQNTEREEVNMPWRDASRL